MAQRRPKLRTQEFLRHTLECVSKREIRKFEWILRQFKEEIRRLSSAKSRIDDAEMAQKTPKLRIKEFLRHTLKSRGKESSYFLCRGLFKLRML